MTDSDQGAPPARALPARIEIDPDEGFGPHMAGLFLEYYGTHSLFVTATVDCLTQRFTRVLIKSGRFPEDHACVQYGDPGMRASLENLLAALSGQGLDNPPVLLMRSATGYEDPQSFLETASTFLGADVVANWLRRLELEDYVGADSLLADH